MAPLMAGLAAASLAGLGTKSYLDKRTKEDEEDELNDVEIDTFDNESYKLDTEEKDYLTLEYARGDKLHIPAEQINML